MRKYAKEPLSFTSCFLKLRAILLFKLQIDCIETEYMLHLHELRAYRT